MRVTVLGSCGAWPEAGRACAGFLVADAGVRLVVDLGYATAPRLFALVPADRIDAVLITHGHPDHCADLHALFRARYYGHRGTGLPPLPVYTPPGVVHPLGPLEGPEGDDLLRETFAVREFTPGARLTVGALRVETMALPHYLPNAGVRVCGPRGRTFAYTGDTGPADAVAEVGRDADLFAVDATFQGTPGGAGASGTEERLNLSATEAGRLAERSGARRLLLTHFWPGLDRRVSVAEAATAFRGEILVADEGAVFEV